MREGKGEGSLPAWSPSPRSSSVKGEEILKFAVCERCTHPILRSKALLDASQRSANPKRMSDLRLASSRRNRPPERDIGNTAGALGCCFPDRGDAHADMDLFGLYFANQVENAHAW